MALPVLTKEEIIQQLDSGSHWVGSTITYRVAQTTQGLVSDGDEAEGFIPASPYVAHFFELAVGLWDDLIQVDFVKTDAVDSDIEIASSNVDVGYAHAYFPDYGGTVWFNFERMGPDFSVDSYPFMALVHEVGHALGLNHMGDYNGTALSPFSFQDTMVYSLMSYFGPEGSAPYTGPADVQQADWKGADGKPYAAQTPMLSDVLALQHIYGASSTTRTGDTIYGFNYNAEVDRAEVYDFSLNLNPILTIFDSAGNDTLDLSGWGSSSIIFLEAGKLSSCNGMTNNLSIAYACVIENATGGSGNDAITGNGVGNRLSGLAGDDRLMGLGGADLLTGGAGADTLRGGAGSDTLIGGAGSDVYVVDDKSDVIMESAWTPGETDTVLAYVSYKLAPGVTVENLKLLGQRALNATGNELANALTGNAAANVLNGGAGADTLDGGAGADTLIGGAGSDTYLVRETGDVVKEGSTAAGDIDTVRSYIDFELDANLENLQLLGLADLKGTGNAADNRLTGNAGANVLKGGAGADTLDGGAGADTLVGGSGHDTYVVREATDVVTESSTAADEIDTVCSELDYVLGANLENLQLLGVADLKGTGNAAHNQLMGNAGANVLDGGAGDDTLDGGAGADTLVGGSGHDTYVVREAADVVTESSTAAGDIDTVRSYVGFTLGENLEDLRLLGRADLSGTGNALANRLTGNAGDNLFNGGEGDDTLDGGLGADTLIGGAGDDVYVVDALDDAVIEDANAGIDTVLARVSHALGDGLEHLTLEGFLAVKGIGNAADNRITGSSRSNELDGGAGNDVLIGGGGTDRLTGGSGKDLFRFTDWADLRLGTRRDVITDFTRGQDRIDLSAIDADGELPGDQAFELVTTGFGSKAGQLRYGEGIVSINADTDEEVEYQIQLIGNAPTALSASDFVL